ncbi:MAG: hydrogenase small subunit [Chloroflexota bacterium]|nr:hydrogenase small subunit [Chloroflexota bacterium]
MVNEIPVVWLQMAACTGCSVSLLNSASPTIKNLLIDQVVPGVHVNLRFHATIMAGAGEPAMEVLEDTAREAKDGFILVVEGAIPTAGDALYGAVGERDGKPVSMEDRLVELAESAQAILAVGTCASFGGIPAAAPNPTGCKPVSTILDARGIKKPLVNIPGCPPHPDWFVGTVAGIILNGLPKPEDLDDYHRPLAFYGKLIHENCPRRAYFDEGKFAKKPGDEGCLYELGCKGPITYADCPLRRWNNGTNWVIGAGAPCNGCTQPEFPDQVAPFYEKLVDIELPTIGA